MSSSITIPATGGGGGGFSTAQTPLVDLGAGVVGLTTPLTSINGGTGNNQGDSSAATLFRSLGIANGDGERAGFANANGLTEVIVNTANDLPQNGAVLFAVHTPGGTPGSCYLSSYNPDTPQFGFKSTNALDTSVVFWWVVERYVP